MLLDDDVVGNRQTQAGTLADRLGRIKRLEDALYGFRVHALAGVGKFEPDVTIFQPGAQRDAAALLDRLRRVDQQVHEDLVDLCRHTFDFGNISELAHHFRLVLDFVPDDIQGAFQRLVEIGELVLRLVNAGKVLEVLDDLGYPIETVL